MRCAVQRARNRCRVPVPDAWPSVRCGACTARPHLCAAVPRSIGLMGYRRVAPPLAAVSGFRRLWWVRRCPGKNAGNAAPTTITRRGNRARWHGCPVREPAAGLAARSESRPGPATRRQRALLRNVANPVCRELKARTSAAPRSARGSALPGPRSAVDAPSLGRAHNAYAPYLRGFGNGLADNGKHWCSSSCTKPSLYLDRPLSAGSVAAADISMSYRGRPHSGIAGIPGRMAADGPGLGVAYVRYGGMLGRCSRTSSTTLPKLCQTSRNLKQPFDYSLAS